MHLLKLIFGIILICNIVACNDSVDATSYLKHIKSDKNGLHQMLRDSSWSYEIQYKSPEAMALQESIVEGRFNQERYNSLLPQFGNMKYFVFSIKANQLNDSLNKLISSKTGWFDFEMQEEFELAHKSDTIKCSLYQFENTFPISGASKMTLAFDDKSIVSPDNNYTFIFKASAFSLKPIAFTFKGTDLLNIPALH